MLSDIFGDFVIDDDSNEVTPTAAIDYVPQIHYDGWFLRIDDEDKETSQLRSSYLFGTGDYSGALQEFIKQLESNKHNRVHCVAIYDGIVRSMLNIPSASSNELIGYLRQYESIATSYGDQMQYWSTARLVLCRFEDDCYCDEYLTIVSMLCATVDLPEHWLSLGEHPHLKVGPNFELGYLTRASLLMERHLNTTAGFVRQSLQSKIDSTRVRLEKISHHEKAKEARKRMAVDLLSYEDRLEMGNLKRPAHECHSKIGVFKNADQISSIVFEFRNRYSFMFVD